MENYPALRNALNNCTTGAHVTRRNGQPLQNLNLAGRGNLHELEAAATSSCRVGPSGPGLAWTGVPAGTCGRGGADSYPSQYPTPAGLPAPAVQTDGTCGTGSGGELPH